MDEISKQIEDLGKENKKTRRDISDLSEQIDGDHKHLRDMSEEISRMNQKLSSVSEDIDSLRSEVKALKSLKETLPDIIRQTLDEKFNSIKPNKVIERVVWPWEKLLSKFRK
jgi:DNA repair exonuclease SbcCD ATPase subunit